MINPIKTPNRNQHGLFALTQLFISLCGGFRHARRHTNNADAGQCGHGEAAAWYLKTLICYVASLGAWARAGATGLLIFVSLAMVSPAQALDCTIPAVSTETAVIEVDVVNDTCSVMYLTLTGTPRNSFVGFDALFGGDITSLANYETAGVGTGADINVVSAAPLGDSGIQYNSDQVHVETVGITRQLTTEHTINGTTYTLVVEYIFQRPDNGATIFQFLAVRVYGGDFGDFENPNIGDTVGPVATISGAPSSIGDMQQRQITVTFDEPVYDFGLSDGSVVAQNASLSQNVMLVSATEYIVEYTPDGLGDVVLTIPAGAVADSQGNRNAAAVSVTILYDDTPPTVSVSNNGPKQGGATDAKLFSTGTTDGDDGSGIASYLWEQVADNSGTPLASPTVSLTNADTATATFTVPNIANGSSLFFNLTVTDDAGNSASAVTEYEVNTDDTRPTVVISGVPDTTDGATPFTATFTFNEAVTDFDDAADITASNASVSAITTVSTTVYTAVITPNGGGNVRVGVPANAAIDSATLGNLAATNVTATLDTTEPTVDSVEFQDSSGTEVTSVDPGTRFKVVVTFSEAMDNASAPDIAFHEGNNGGGNTVDLSNWASGTNGWSNNDTVYTFNYIAPQTLASDIAIRSTVVSNIDDAAGNDLDDHAENDTFNVTENTLPTVLSVEFQDSSGTEVTSVDLGEIFKVVVTFSEAMDNASAPDIAFHEGLGGGGSTFDLSNWASSGNGWSSGATVYTFNYTVPDQLASAVVIRSTVVSSINDATGNALENHAENDTFDMTGIGAPMVTITSDVASLGLGQTAVITFTFSEAVFNFDENDVSVSVGSITAPAVVSGSGGLVFTATYTPADDYQGDAVIQVGTDYQDDDGNDGMAGELTITTDTTVLGLDPVSIASSNVDPSRAFAGDQITVTFTADEDLATGADEPVVTIGGVSATVAGGPQAFTASVTVDDSFAPGLVAFTIDYQDLSGIPGLTVSSTTDGSSVTIGYSAEVKQELIANFVTNRMGHVLNNQPDFTNFMTGTGVGGQAGALGLLNMNGSSSQTDDITSTSFVASFATSLSHVSQRLGEGDAARLALLGEADSHQGEELTKTAALSEAQLRGYDVWLRSHLSYSDTGTASSHYWSGQFGSHIFLSPDVLVGAMVQLDQSEQTDSQYASTVEGLGWMAGPYFVAKIPGHPLYIDAHASWGTTDNTLSLGATGSSDDFTTDRWLVSSRISGNFEAAGWTINPSINTSYMQETQHAYVDDIGQQIGEQQFSVGELRFGPSFSRNFALADDRILHATFGVTGVWNFAVENGAASTTPLGSENIRARMDAGLTFPIGMWGVFGFNGYYDGLGADDYEQYGATVQIKLPLN